MHLGLVVSLKHPSDIVEIIISPTDAGIVSSSISCGVPANKHDLRIPSEPFLVTDKTYVPSLIS